MLPPWPMSPAAPSSLSSREPTPNLCPCPGRGARHRGGAGQGPQSRETKTDFLWTFFFSHFLLSSEPNGLEPPRALERREGGSGLVSMNSMNPNGSKIDRRYLVM